MVNNIVVPYILIFVTGLIVMVLVFQTTPVTSQPADWAKKGHKPFLSTTESRYRHHRGLVENLLLSTGLPIKFWEYQLVKVIAAILGLCAGLTINNWVIALAGVFLGIKLPNKILMHLKEKRKILLARQLEPTLQQIAIIYRINNSLETTFEQVLTTIPTPLSEEFEQMLSDLKVAGMSLEESLNRLANRLDLVDFHYFVRIALMTQRYGGETRELLLQIPQTIRDRQLMRAELETEIAGAKQQAWILLAATPVFFIVYWIMRPDFVKILTDTTQGKIGMSLVALLSMVSVFFIDKISEQIT